ncbi:hypothetical protein [Hymenobacter fodinae]|uniref:Lipoprotein n=1 Tax=Hymenobacter fodinae TaxID=2510796 RepID=A0A4Z0P3I9_9BACT|nr:hypothetical protein [Hymenobacter fodinae]TGE06273.1 hypothetical protein EU556_15580 [Hymenobacter fodinae]
MKLPVFLLLTGLGLGACHKSDVKPDEQPSEIAAAFDKDFTLHYQQQASLPTQQQPELTVKLDEVAFTYCPPNAKCLVGTMAWPTLRITDAQGQTQVLPQVTPPKNLLPNDTLSVRANGRRYLLTYVQWQLDKQVKEYDNPTKQQFGLTFRVTKPN